MNTVSALICTPPINLIKGIVGLKGGKIHYIDLNRGMSTNKDMLLCQHFFIFLTL